MAFNLKINSDGTYREYYGWTIITNVHGSYKIIENFVGKNNVLSKYFSALPSSSYHVTLYNLWSNRTPLLYQQKNHISSEVLCDKKEELISHSNSIGFFNPDGCLDGLFSTISNMCKEHEWENVTLKVNKVSYTGGTISISIGETGKYKTMDSLRGDLIDLCDKDDGLRNYHVTIAYKYKNIPDEDICRIKHEISILDILLSGQTFSMEKPNLCSFKSMGSFESYSSNL